MYEPARDGYDARRGADDVGFSCKQSPLYHQGFPTVGTV